MSNYKVRETGDLFDPATGAHVGVMDLNGQEQLFLTPAQVAAVQQSIGVPVKTTELFTGLLESQATAAAFWNYSGAINLPLIYTAVRIGYPVLGAGGDVTGLSMICAATDDVGDMSRTNTEPGRRFLSPKKGGTSYDSVTANGPGWRQVTWGGVSTMSKVASTDATVTDYVWSDIIDVAGTADASGRFPGWAPLLVRIQQGTANYSRVGQIIGYNTAQCLTEMGAAYNMALYKNVADYVAAPSGWTSATSTSSDALAALPIIIEAWGPATSKTIMLSGDSRFAQPSSDASTTQWRTFQFYLRKSLLNVGKKVTLLSAAMGAVTTTKYYNRFATITSTVKPDVSLYLGYSINDGVPTAALLQSAKVRVLRWLDACKTLGAKPVLLSIFPYGTGFGAAYSDVLAFDAWCASLGVTYLSPLSLYGNGTNGDWQAGINVDANHMTSVGYSDLATRLSAIVANYV